MVSRASSPVPFSVPGVAAGLRTPSLPSRGVRGFAWAVLGLNVLVILWGAVVRATGSGNGCGEHWPLCNGTLDPHWKTLATIIEFAHRASVGVAGAALAILAVWVWRETPVRHIARFMVGASVLFYLNEGLLGALLVEFGKTAQDHSPSRAVYLAGHLANTLLLLAALVLIPHFLGRDRARMRGGVTFRHLGFALVGLISVILVGASGSVAALADTLYPAHSLQQAFAQDLGASANWLLHLRWIHPALGFLAALWIVFAVATSRNFSDHGTRRMGTLVLGLLALQIGLGIADVLKLAPTWLQITHLLGADLFWIALVVLSARLCVVSIGCPGGSRACSG